MRKFLQFCLMFLTLGLSACLTEKTTDSAAGAENITITGSFGYRERIALLPGAKAIVTLNDVSRADAKSVELARQEINMDDQSVPVDYTLSVAPEALQDNMRYAVRAEIRAPNDALMWTTDRAHLIDVSKGSQEMGIITLMKVGGRKPEKTSHSLNGEWYVHSVDEYPVVEGKAPKIEFTNDGKVSGTTGCNRFSGTYTIKGSQITFGPLAMTKRACISDLGQQEKFFTDVLNSIDAFTFDEAGHLVLTAANGRFLKAQKN